MTGSPAVGPELVKRRVNSIFSGEDFTRFSCLGFALSTVLMFPAERYVRAAANLFSVTLGPQGFFRVAGANVDLFFSFEPLLASRGPGKP